MTCTSWPASRRTLMPSRARFPPLTPRANITMSRRFSQACLRSSALTFCQWLFTAPQAASQMPLFRLPFSMTALYCLWWSEMRLLSRFTASARSTHRSLASLLTTVVLPAQEGPISSSATGLSDALPTTRAAAMIASSSRAARGRNSSSVKSSASPVARSSARASRSSRSSAGANSSEWPGIRRSHLQVWPPQGDSAAQSIWRLIAW
mmetsp:Transcript_4518/g.13192  ORF Transcript_4518/g.13192 Transcript_4518/m.13192 type:complete len:207 (+) Transcript_4518:288-908(+)